jgi:hypothetical protein
MKISTSYWPKPGPSKAFDWSAVDSDVYDGAEDSATRNQIGYGATEAEAIADLMEQIEPEPIPAHSRTLVEVKPEIRYCAARANLGLAYRFPISDCGRPGCQRACRGYL